VHDAIRLGLSMALSGALVERGATILASWSDGHGLVPYLVQELVHRVAPDLPHAASGVMQGDLGRSYLTRSRLSLDDGSRSAALVEAGIPRITCRRVRERSRLRARFSMFSSLPNVHPFLVHFPIALFTMALFLDLALVLRFRYFWIDRAALLGLGVSALSSFATAWSGKLAADSLTPSLDGATAAAVASHGDWAFATVVLFFVVALLRIEAAWRDRDSSSPRLNRARLLALPLALVAEGCLLATAGRGGELVYRHGVGVVSGP
jgi:uncharacterized membrane protein